MKDVNTCNRDRGKNAQSSCDKSLHHISRIQGQMRTLKKYIEEGAGHEEKWKLHNECI